MTDSQIAVLEKHGLANASAIVRAAESAGLELHIAAALAEQESGGQNIYGHDAGGVLSTLQGPVIMGSTTYAKGSNIPVTQANFKTYFLPVVLDGGVSNGVGPVQITYGGYFRQSPEYPWWDPFFSCLKGFQIMLANLKTADIVGAGSRYNSGSTSGNPGYGNALKAKAETWKTRLEANTGETMPSAVQATELQRRLVEAFVGDVGKRKYSMNMKLRWPVGEYADCSSLARHWYKEICGIEIGTYTGDQQRYGVEVFGAEEQTVEGAMAKLQLADLIFFDWDGVGVDGLDHVEMYIGNGKTCGHGGPGMGPTIKDFRSQWNSAHTVKARRYVQMANIQEEKEETKQMTEEEAKMLRDIWYTLTPGEEGKKARGDVLWNVEEAVYQLTSQLNALNQAREKLNELYRLVKAGGGGGSGGIAVTQIAGDYEITIKPKED